MTRQELDSILFKKGMKAKYRGEDVEIIGVDYNEPSIFIKNNGLIKRWVKISEITLIDYTNNVENML